jgi:hypothetical protein
MEGTDPEELRSESAGGGHAAPRLSALPLHAGLPSVLPEDDHYHGIHVVAAFQHDWRSNDALFFAHHNAVGRNDGSSDASQHRGNANLLRGWLMQGCEPERAPVVSGRRTVLGLPHDGQQDLRDAKRRHPSSQANGDGTPAHGFDDCA